MLNYYIAMDYKSKDNIKNYAYYLEKSAACEKVHPDSLLELANHNIDNADLSNNISTSCMQRISHQREQWHIIKLKIFYLTINVLMMWKFLYKELLNDGFDGFAFNRLIDIMLEKNEKSEASELVDRFMKSEHACHSIRLNKLKLEIDNFEARKSISTLCNEMIRDEIII